MIRLVTAGPPALRVDAARIRYAALEAAGRLFAGTVPRPLCGDSLLPSGRLRRYEVSYPRSQAGRV
jgi:hypothetical protein